jgi:hypothetical protein
VPFCFGAAKETTIEIGGPLSASGESPTTHSNAKVVKSTAHLNAKVVKSTAHLTSQRNNYGEARATTHLVSASRAAMIGTPARISVSQV